MRVVRGSEGVRVVWGSGVGVVWGSESGVRE